MGYYSAIKKNGVGIWRKMGGIGNCIKNKKLAGDWEEARTVTRRWGRGP